jgi:hypothetical protein
MGLFIMIVISKIIIEEIAKYQTLHSVIEGIKLVKMWNKLNSNSNTVLRSQRLFYFRKRDLTL